MTAKKLNFQKKEISSSDMNLSKLDRQFILYFRTKVYLFAGEDFLVIIQCSLKNDDEPLFAHQSETVHMKHSHKEKQK